LRTALSRLGASVVEPSEATLILQVGMERFEQRNLSLTARARAAELELRASVDFSLQLDDQWLIEDETLSVVDQMLNDPLNVVGKTEELRLLQGELRTTLVEALTRRIDYRLAADNADKA
jgi:LPS-assembly lipoprotein